MAEALIHVENVNKCFNHRVKDKELYALDVVNFSVKAGEFFCILGPSGCGKSTLLSIMAGFQRPTSGRVLINGLEVHKPQREYVTMFQEHSLFPWRTVQRNVEFGLEISGMQKQKRRKAAAKYIELVGLQGFEQRYPRELSVGMKQRVQLARTLAAEPEIIYMDEPLGALDPMTRERLREELSLILEREQKTIIFVTHDVQSALTLGDRIALFSPAPGKLKLLIDVPLKRPRDRFDPQLLKIERRILQEFRRSQQ